ncbi:hypothetical protein [Dictyobacter kobayashii]|uniref:Uncharacterized protein n=1 Tax=Dictyobacter kobayashii TaxID=2014872 RepID=A0A402AI13_9CHLR|nr:hypothetical protein [Dictyobacter kobayashii]GCE18695.1 hypothetical protein KDK_24950 [Dictyobacter kobayashii]
MTVIASSPVTIQTSEQSVPSIPGWFGEVARTRTMVLQAHSQHWLGTFGGPGNGDYRNELTRASEAIISYAGWLCMPLSHILVRLDGLYGTLAVVGTFLSSGMGLIVRCKDYGLLECLLLPPASNCRQITRATIPRVARVVPSSIAPT